LRVDPKRAIYRKAPFDGPASPAQSPGSQRQASGDTACATAGAGELATAGDPGLFQLSRGTGKPESPGCLPNSPCPRLVPILADPQSEGPTSHLGPNASSD